MNVGSLDEEADPGMTLGDARDLRGPGRPLGELAAGGARANL